MRTLSTSVAAALAIAVPAAAPAQSSAEEAAFASWLTGDWADPRVHRCDQVWVRIRVEAGRIRHYSVTYGRAVPGMTGEILEIEPDGSALIYNALLDRQQRVRFVTRDAHVLEKENGAGGVTFVRCEGTSSAPAS